jgi:hypothetical protein
MMVATPRSSKGASEPPPSPRAGRGGRSEPSCTRGSSAWHGFGSPRTCLARAPGYEPSPRKPPRTKRTEPHNRRRRSSREHMGLDAFNLRSKHLLVHGPLIMCRLRRFAEPLIRHRFVVCRRFSAIVLGRFARSVALSVEVGPFHSFAMQLCSLPKPPFVYMQAPRFVPAHLKTLFDTPLLTLPLGDFEPASVRMILTKLKKHKFPVFD